jgi:hypothetical protein
VDPSGFESQKTEKGAHQWAGSAAENDARHERLNWLASDLYLHGRTKGDITTFLKHSGDDKVLKEYGYSEPGFWTEGRSSSNAPATPLSSTSPNGIRTMARVAAAWAK